MKNTLQVHPETLARLMVQIKDRGFDSIMTYLGFPSLRCIANPAVPLDQMWVPDEWLSEEAKARYYPDEYEAITGTEGLIIRNKTTGKTHFK